MKRDRCRYCGKPIGEVPYGSGTRWTHLIEVRDGQADVGIFCRTNQAAP